MGAILILEQGREKIILGAEMYNIPFGKGASVLDSMKTPSGHLALKADSSFGHSPAGSTILRRARRMCRHLETVRHKLKDQRWACQASALLGLMGMVDNTGMQKNRRQLKKMKYSSEKRDAHFLRPSNGHSSPG
eukprot:5589365-Pyramimonas_sp.AAC.1